VRFFGVVKGGLLNFGIKGPVTIGTFSDSLSDGDTRATFYPGGGVEFNAGRLGIRLEGGDEMFWVAGRHHNFRFTLGPQIRF
jgi:hypothetical protein